jgi:hypothetical protein
MCGLLLYPAALMNIFHVTLRGKHVIKNYRPSYSLTTNRTPHTHSVVTNWNIVYYVGIFDVPVMGVLGRYETTKMKPGFVAR